ncbi:5583_t:CDS:1 [Acaulospora colombiana]|uniref:5583_t:CDS:1 n=1 Tax=Acaulospora colombiana TaxID=27376 RepID=A0ACA9KYL8_9GLOM|nr:5583_t:CDS:1 [Acaulospora colombiana]
MSQGDRLDAARNFKMYVEKANKDSTSYSHALYSLCALTIQSATAATTGNRLRVQQAFNYYQKAKEAESRYEYLYGRKLEMTDVKRTAVAFFEQKNQKETNKVEKDSTKEAERLAPILQQLFKKCNHCNSLSRRNADGELNNGKLFVCAGCGHVNYCSKECQKKDWKKHKQQCAYLKELTKNG